MEHPPRQPTEPRDDDDALGAEAWVDFPDPPPADPESLFKWLLRQLEVPLAR